jgi:hypothetical protein
MAADRDGLMDFEKDGYVEGWLDGFRVSRESMFGAPPPSPPSAPPPDSKKDKKNKKDKKPKKDKNDKKGQKDMKTVKKSKKDTKNKKDKKGKNDKKDEKAKKTEKGVMTSVIIKPSSTCQKDESIMTLHVVGSDTIGEVKRVIEHKRRLEGRPPAIKMALIFGNKGLADANTLMFYNIPDNAHLRLEVKCM